MHKRFQNVSTTLNQTRENAVSFCHALQRCREFFCPSGWKIYNQSCYRFWTELKDWDSAKQECESQNSHLIIINSQQKQDLIIKSSEFTESDYWIGLRDTKKDGNFTWVDGTPVSYIGWAPREPNRRGDENCAALRREGWNDARCTNTHHFICEKRTPSCIGAADFEKYCP
ncbi:C-type lectin domain family 17, member A-like [Mustelus asterias]